MQWPAAKTILFKLFREGKEDWHEWFAWYPKRINKRVYWLETVERVKKYAWNDQALCQWKEYRTLEEGVQARADKYNLKRPFRGGPSLRI